MTKVSVKQACQSLSPLLVLGVIEAGNDFNIENFVKMSKPILDKTAGTKEKVFGEVKKAIEKSLREVKKII